MSKVDLKTVFNFKNSGIYPIQFEKEKYRKLTGDLPEYFEYKSEINRNHVIQLIKAGHHNGKTEFLAVLFWGIYFRVTSRSPKTQSSLIQYIISPDFDENWLNVKRAVIEEKDPKRLFKRFLNPSDCKIPGLSYAYFTKIFHFLSEAYELETKYPILDKWLCRAWCAIDSSQNENLNIYNTYFRDNEHSFNCLLTKKKPEAYSHYIQFLNSLSQTFKIPVTEIEQCLFGINLKEDSSIKNPRLQYIKWAKANNLNV